VDRPAPVDAAGRFARASGESNLGAGESEALSLAVEIQAARVLVDERAARRVAQAMGLSVVGTLGVLLAAKRKGLVAEVRPLIDALLQRGFWVAPHLVERALFVAGEGDGT
jgi:predicted nucleic acid-binding protein